MKRVGRSRGRSDVKMDFSGKRSHFKIIADILSVSEKGASKTRIMYKSNLSYEMLERYLSMLKERGLIRVENVESTFKYFTTDKGRKFLREYEKLEKILIQTI